MAYIACRSGGKVKWLAEPENVGWVGLRGANLREAEGMLAGFAAYLLLARKVKYSTIRVYSWAARRLISDLGGPEVSMSSRLRRFYKAVRRATGYKPAKKWSVTKRFMAALKAHLDLTTLDGKNMWAACSLAFSAMLRSAEYCKKASSDSSVHPALQRQDIRFRRREGESKPWAVEIHIRCSKTDQWGEGAVVVLPATWGVLCAVRALWELYCGQGSIMATRAAFVYRGQGRKKYCALTYADVTAVTKAVGVSVGIDPARVATHSYRAGGASTYVAAGVPEHIIRQMGRWRSDAWLGYVRSVAVAEGFILASRVINDGDLTTGPYTMDTFDMKPLKEGALITIETESEYLKWCTN